MSFSILEISMNITLEWLGISCDTVKSALFIKSTVLPFDYIFCRQVKPLDAKNALCDILLFSNQTLDD